MTGTPRIALLICLLSASCTKSPNAPSEIAPPSQTPVITSELSGVVTETPPTASTPVGGAVVEVVTGSYAGRKTTTDASGRYLLTGVAGDFDIDVSRAGFETLRARVTVIKSGSRLDVPLLPDAVPVQTTFSGNLCADRDAYAIPFLSPCLVSPVQAHHAFPIHRAGTVEVELLWRYREDYSPEWMWLEMKCGSDQRTQQKFGLLAPAGSPLRRARLGEIWPPGPERLDIPVSGPGLCEVALLKYYSFKPIGATNYQIDITRPK